MSPGSSYHPEVIDEMWRIEVLALVKCPLLLIVKGYYFNLASVEEMQRKFGENSIWIWEILRCVLTQLIIPDCYKGLLGAFQRN